MMRFPRTHRQRWLTGSLVALALAAGAIGLLTTTPLRAALFSITGEEKTLPQLKGLSDLAVGLLRPQVALAETAPLRHTDLNPFGVNVFLNEEVEPAKREKTVALAAEAGFHWLRQEFPWEDIEIHGKGDFEDRRNQPYRSAWQKYDQIVDLAEAYGMELIVRVSTPPNWSRAAGNAAGSFAPPDDYADFGDFVYTLVSRYRGRVRYFQLWNEPNIYPEWGSYAISPEDYTLLLKEGATRARQADPDVVIISGALASTIALQPDAAPPANALNDLLFLQRMYDAGAAPYFDVMAMQAYGLWSGPTDRRMHPRVINFSRPQYVRDVMVTNGDAHKPIWISEMAWNAVPDAVADKRFGQVDSYQQGRYAVQAYQRAMSEWPWVGVVNTWYFKRASDQWEREQKPEAYFRLADPDFTLQPVYYALKDFITSYQPQLYPGQHRPDGWAIEARGNWESVIAANAPYGSVLMGREPGAQLAFHFAGSDLQLIAVCPDAACQGKLVVTVDGGPPVTVLPTPVDAKPTGVAVAGALRDGDHLATVVVEAAPVAIAAILVGKAN